MRNKPGVLHTGQFKPFRNLAHFASALLAVSLAGLVAASAEAGEAAASTNAVPRPPGYGRKELSLAPPVAERAFASAYRDNFSTGAAGGAPTGWLATQTGAGKAQWQLANDPATSGQPLVLKQSGEADYPLCLRTNTAVRDGFVETRFKALSGVKDQAGGVVWRARDADNYYICRANALEDNVVLYKVQHGKRRPLDIVGRAGGYGVTAPVLKQDWNRLRVEFVGPTHRVFFNDRHLFDVDDATFAEPGHVGVWTKADSVTLFDDFQYGSTDGGH